MRVAYAIVNLGQDLAYGRRVLVLPELFERGDAFIQRADRIAPTRRGGVGEAKLPADLRTIRWEIGARLLGESLKPCARFRVAALIECRVRREVARQQRHGTARTFEGVLRPSEHPFGISRPVLPINPLSFTEREMGVGKEASITLARVLDGHHRRLEQPFA